MSKLVIFDGNAIMHRAFHALPPLTTKHGKPINAVYGLISMLLRVIADLEPTHIVFAFDRPEPTFRKEIHKEYQAHRPEMDEELTPQFPRAYEVLSAMGIPVYDKAGYEADDVIGTIANSVTGSKDPIASLQDDNSVEQVIVVTGDRDMLQLVNPKTKLYMPGRGLSGAKIYGKEEAIEKMGVPPEQIVDLKGLIGDPSDNYKGVPGVGPKTGIKLLKEYKTIEDIYENLDKLPEGLRKKLEENRESAFTSQDLAEIRTDVEVEFSLEDAGAWRVDGERVINLFEEYGFNTLTKRVKKIGEEIARKRQQTLL